MTDRERIAEELFSQDWGEENGFAMSNASNGNWGEQTDEWFRSHYYRRADEIIALLPSLGYRQIDPKKLRVLSDEEIFNLGFNTPYKSRSKSLSVYTQGVVDGSKATIDKVKKDFV